MTGNTKRFSDRVEDYIKFRPDYPREVVKHLEEKMKLNQSKIIADIGSGTGISSNLFLKNGFTVIGVEPNKEMREAAEKMLSGFSNFTSINGTAEKTTLIKNSIDVVFCAQAFHWFDREKSKVEFHRILKHDGNIVLAWNSRNTKSDFQIAYENALKNNLEEYKIVNHRNIRDEEIELFFHPKKMNKFCVANKQTFDLDGLKGRLNSSSYFPKSGKVHDKLIGVMEQIFEKYHLNGAIEFDYDTEIYWC
ncbi:MAG: class I SAM-dependent methyltransferase [Ginsengibacter sp.]